MLPNRRAFSQLYSPLKSKKTSYDWDSDRTGDKPPTHDPSPTFRSPSHQYQEPTAELGSSDKSDYRNEIDKLYGTGEAMNRFQEHVKNVPQQGDYSPGVMGRIFAGIAGGSEGYLRGAGAGIKVARTMMDEPYHRAVEEYSLKGQGLKAAADIEQDRDAKRVGYLNQLRQFDKDAYDAEIKGEQVKNARVTVAAQALQASTASRLAELTSKRDVATDERARKTLDNEIQKTKDALASQQAASRDRQSQTKAFQERTEMMGKRPHGSTSVKIISPQSQLQSEIDSAQELLNEPEFASMKSFVTVHKDRVEINEKPNDGWFSDSTPDKKLMQKFRDELDKRKKKRMNMILSASSDEDIIDLDS